MRILIAEDDYVSRRFLFKFFSRYGVCDVIADGKEALEAFMFSVEEDEPYDVICLDVMMPKMNGLQVLAAITALEAEKGIKNGAASKKFIITALNDLNSIREAYSLGCHVYVTKPINTEKLIEVIKKLELIE